MLIHRRAKGKKTWPGFWTNTCCSHPRKGETYARAAKRRLMQELRLRCPLKEIFKFVYKAKYDSKYGEYELDHVFVSKCDKAPKIDKKEIAEIKFISVPALLKDVKKNPKKYSPWFKIALPKVVRYAKAHKLFE
jgi:isopentenyl-diphosphate delta-isomerase